MRIGDRRSDVQAQRTRLTTFFPRADLFVQQGQVPVPTCDSCDSSSSCLEDCIPKEIVDAALDGPLAHNISDYLMVRSLTPLSRLGARHTPSLVARKIAMETGRLLPFILHAVDAVPDDCNTMQRTVEAQLVRGAAH